MSKPTITIHNTESGEIIEREMTDAEFKQYQKDVAAGETRKTALEEKVAARQAIADRLGLTADELKLFLG